MEFCISLFNHLKDRGFFRGTCFWQRSNSVLLFGHYSAMVIMVRIRPLGTRFPELYRCDQHISQVDRADILLCQNNCIYWPAVPCDTDIYDLCNIVMVESQLHVPDNAYQAVDLYLHLRNEITSALWCDKVRICIKLAKGFTVNNNIIRIYC